VIIRAKTRVEEIRKDRYAIVVDEIPYQVNKASMIERSPSWCAKRSSRASPVLQDESDRVGVRVVVELKRDATPEVVLNQLFRFTQMQTSFGCNMLALNGGRPEQLTLRDFLTAFIDFREEVVARRTALSELRKARERSACAVRSCRRGVQCRRGGGARSAPRRRGGGPREADVTALARRGDRRLHQADRRSDPHGQRGRHLQPVRDAGPRDPRSAAAAPDRSWASRKSPTNSKSWPARSRTTSPSCASRERIMAIISDELAEVREKFAVPRRTEITDWSGDMEDEDLIEREDMVVTITQGGYIKRTPLVDFRAQKRGGKGLSGGDQGR
jgi:DNA gyrase subunit A